jgi:hypothetical protein
VTPFQGGPRAANPRKGKQLTFERVKKMQENLAVLYSQTKSNDTISQEDKTSFKKFCSIVWSVSRTNLHYIDFCVMFGDDLKAMFKPVKL